MPRRMDPARVVGVAAEVRDRLGEPEIPLFDGSS